MCQILCRVLEVQHWSFSLTIYSLGDTINCRRVLTGTGVRHEGDKCVYGREKEQVGMFYMLEKLAFRTQEINQVFLIKEVIGVSVIVEVTTEDKIA